LLHANMLKDSVNHR